MNIYVMRHGTTIWNEIGRIQGLSNNRLSTEGKKLVERTANEIKNLDFDIIFSSPVMRTMQTTNIVNQFLNLKVIKDERITDIDQGIFAGRFKTSLTEHEKYLRKTHDKNCGVESWEETFLRVKDFMNEIKSKKEYKNILIVTHDYPATCIENILTDKDIDFKNYTHSRNFKNAEIRKFVLKQSDTLCMGCFLSILELWSCVMYDII